MNSVLKMMNSVLKMMNSVLKMMNSVLKMMNFVFKMMDFAFIKRRKTKPIIPSIVVVPFPGNVYVTTAMGQLDLAGSSRI